MSNIQRSAPSRQPASEGGPTTHNGSEGRATMDYILLILLCILLAVAFLSIYYGGLDKLYQLVRQLLNF